MATKKLKALSGAEVRSRLPELQGWAFSRGALRCEFRFESFKTALAFVVRVGEMAEKANHHPDIDIRYSLVRLALSTHDVSGISDRDFALAAAIDGKSRASKSV